MKSVCLLFILFSNETVFCFYYSEKHHISLLSLSANEINLHILFFFSKLDVCFKKKQEQRFTLGDDQDFGSAAGETVQQRLGANVGVEQRHNAAQFEQTQPGPDEVGFVPTEQSHGVPLLEPGVGLQSSGHSVTLSVHLTVRVRAVLENNERFVRLLSNVVQKTVQDAVELFVLRVLSHSLAHFQQLHGVTKIREKVAVSLVK